MSQQPEACDLCGLPLGSSRLSVQTGTKNIRFCCEGCQGIWRMLNPAPVAGDTGQQPPNHDGPG